MILKLNEDKTLSRVSIAPSISKEQLKEIGGYIDIDDALVPNSLFLKYDEKNNVVIDIERENEFKTSETKRIAKAFLVRTDFLLLVDNPKNLTQEEINYLISFRKELRNAELELPQVPSFLENLGVLQ